MRDYFGDDVAATYDADSASRFGREELDVTTRFLARLAGSGTALEFAVGTGRVALPLADRGVQVHGIDLSEAMLARLHAKPGAERIATTAGDYTTTRVPGEFTLVYLVFNTIMNVTTQEAQVACFANAAAHLALGGHFVVETSVPDLRDLRPGETTVHFLHGPPTWGYDVIDTATQKMSSNYVTVTEDGEGRFRSIPFRYAWPAEFDLMARLAGLSLVSRHADWTGAPFTADSPSHVSVWQRIRQGPQRR